MGMARMARGRRVGECSELSIPGREHILFHRYPLLTTSASTSQTKPLNLSACGMRRRCALHVASFSSPSRRPGKKKVKNHFDPISFTDFRVFTNGGEPEDKSIAK